MAYTPYHNILGSNGVVQVLIEKGEGPGSVKNLTITNTHASNEATVNLSIRNLTTGGESYYIIKNLVIAIDATYNVPIPFFNNKVYSLVITLGGTSETVDVIIT
tara:strand:- start:1652 stop:1963 length:312 start_codon:yes stop_codon:yes gene_type:complete